MSGTGLCATTMTDQQLELWTRLRSMTEGLVFAEEKLPPDEFGR